MGIGPQFRIPQVSPYRKAFPMMWRQPSYSTPQSFRVTGKSLTIPFESLNKNFPLTTSFWCTLRQLDKVKATASRSNTWIFLITLYYSQHYWLGNLKLDGQSVLHFVSKNLKNWGALCLKEIFLSILNLFYLYINWITAGKSRISSIIVSKNMYRPKITLSFSYIS